MPLFKLYTLLLTVSAFVLLVDIDCLLCFTTSFFFMLNAWSGVLYHISYRDTPVCVCVTYVHTVDLTFVNLLVDFFS